MADQFCLRWNNFQTNIVSALDSMKCSEDLVDVTLTCEGRNIKAHKVILSACSPYFRTVFRDNPCQHPIIILKDVLAEDILNLLSYMYQGEVFIEESKLSSFLNTAALLQVKGLTGVAQQGREIITQCSSANPTKKLYTQLTISSKGGQSNVQKEFKVSSHQLKKRRNSANDRILNDFNKNYVKKNKHDNNEGNGYIDKPVHDIANDQMSQRLSENMSENLPTVSENKSENNLPSNNSNSDHHKNTKGEENDHPPVTIKSENCESPPTLTDTDVESGYDQTEFCDPLHPEYENSMLARSLLSGTHSLKSDTNSNCTPPKQKPSPKIDSNSLAGSRDGGNASPIVPRRSPQKANLAAPEDQVKTERLSPKQHNSDLEPEILISEHNESGDGSYGKDHSQTMLLLSGSFPGMQSQPSTSQNASILHGQANHAAICGDCPHCGKKYSNQSALKYHVRLMHSDLTNRLCCYLCPCSFTMRETFKEHMWTAHGQRN